MDANGLHISSLLALTPEKRTQTLRQLTDAQADQLFHDWEFVRYAYQAPPPWAWQTWLFLAGRGAGKTRTGAEWVRAKVKSGCGRIALIAPTTTDTRKVMVEGVSGILATAWRHDRDHRGNPMGIPTYEPSKREITWANGAIATTYSAEEPDRLRGPAHDALWADEICAWWEPENAWDMAQFGLREGLSPQALVTTTPRPIPLIREMITNSGGENPTVALTKAKTADNRANLSPAFLSKIVAKYKGTRLGRQELDGEVIEQVEGALWTRDGIEESRVRLRDPKADRDAFRRIVVAIDPAVSSGGTSALTGIVVGGVGFDNRGYVLADNSGRYSPAEWAKKSIALFDLWQADRIVAEGNQGGEMVRHTLETERKNVPVRIVHASQSKQARAEPVAALSEQNRIAFCGTFAELENQLCSWAPLEGKPSPDRLDAMVWAFTELMLGGARAPIIAAPLVVSGTRQSPGG